jgi:transglutaminase-like putative cysteine protease
VVVAHAVSDGRALDLDADVENGRLVGTLSTGGEQLPVSFPLPADALVSGAFGTPLALPELEPGVKVSIAGFDPMTLGTGRTELELIGPETLTIDGSPVPTRRVEVRQGAIVATVFLDAQGELVRAETPFGLTLERRTTSGSTRALAAAEVVSLAMIRPTLSAGAPPERGARRLRLALRGAPTEIPTSSRQRRLADGSFELLAEAPPTGSTPADPPEVRLHLAAEPLIQSDHPRIRETAATIVGELTDPWGKAQALADWVFETIDKSPAASVPSAIEVLETKAGDCNEHTVLYTALARAAAFPTRIAIGLVWSDQHQAFAYHAWPEVWIRDRFIAIDPTLGEPIADATHIALLHGGLERWLSLGAWLGAIEIEILEVE